MRHLTTIFAISFLFGGFTFAQANEGPADCSQREGIHRERCETENLRKVQNGEITDVDPLTETAQGGDRDGDVGGGDFGGDADRAAASTAAE